MRSNVSNSILRHYRCDALLDSCRDMFRSNKLTSFALADRVRMLEILGARMRHLPC